MKKTLLFVLCLAACSSFAQVKKAIINGTSELKDRNLIYAIYYDVSTETKAIDSALVTDGKFKLEVPVHGTVSSVLLYAKPSGKGFQQQDARDSKSLIVDQGGATIAIKDAMRTSVISNSAIEKEKDRYVSYMYLPEADSAKMGMYINGVSAIIMSVGGEPDTSSAEKLQKYKTTMARLKQLDDFVQQKLTLQRKFIKENPDSYFSLKALEDVARYSKDPNEAIPMFSTLSSALRKIPEAAVVLSSLEKIKTDRLNPKKEGVADKIKLPPKPLAVGTMAPDFEQYGVDGKAVKLSDFKGKYVLVDFWASWCVPCRKENPNLIKAYEQFKDRNFTILGIALEEKGHKDAWLAAIKKDGLPWTQVADIDKAENPVAIQYGVSSIPTNFLIDPSGKIIATNLRAETLFDKLTEILTN